MSQNSPNTKRLFVGGLFDEVTPEDLKQRFAKYGTVKSVDLKTKKNSFGDIVKTFAFMDFDSTPAKLRQCIDIFNKARWKGRELKIQLAEDSFLDKLAKEREMLSVVKLWSPEQSKTTADSEEPHRAVQQLKVKGPPGTAIEGKEGWVVGKYSRPVPVLRMKQNDGKKTVIFDPSKNCHGLKRFDDDNSLPNISFDQLTWQLEEKKLPPKATIPKPSKPKNIQATKKMTSDDYDSVSGSEGERDKTVDTSNGFIGRQAREMDDSDNDSRGSCDTDEIVRRAKSGYSYNFKDTKKSEVKNSSPISNVKSSVASSLAKKIQPSKKSPLNVVAKELVFSEFSDGVSSSSDAEKDLESENESSEDVFDLLESGQIEKLLNTSQSQSSKSKKEKVTASKVSPDFPEQLSRKRKKCQTESSAVVKIESSASLKTAEVPRKRKISAMLEQEIKLASADRAEKMPLNAQVESASVIGEKSKRRKVSQMGSENTLPSTSLTKAPGDADLSCLKTSATAEKSKKRKRSDSEEDESQPSKTNVLEIKKGTAVALANLKHDETKDDAMPAQPKRPYVKSTKDLESKPEAVEKIASKDSPVKKMPISEQKKSLEILQSVLPAKASQAMGFRDFQSFRYDPSAADHDKFEIHDRIEKSQQPVQLKKDEKEKKEEKETQKLPVTEVKKFSEVDASVVDVFKAPADAPFSLGALFGPEESSDEEVAESQSVVPNWKKKPKVVVDNENEERIENNIESKSKVSKNVEGGFFYHSEDPRLKASKFCREKDLEELRAEWQEKRPHFVESYRMKKKKPLRSLGRVTRSNENHNGKPAMYKGKGSTTTSRGNVFKKNWNRVTQ